MKTRRKNIKKNITKKNLIKKNSKTLSENIDIKEIINTSQNKLDNDRFNNLIYGFDIEKYMSANLEKNDYYTFVNQIWLDEQKKKNEKEMKYLSQIDDFKVTQNNVLYDIYDIVENYTNNNKNIISLELKNFKQSADKFNSIKSSKFYLKKIINTIDEIRKNKQNLWKLLALINKNEVINPYAPFEWKKDKDIKGTEEYIDYIYPHNFVIFDLSSYDDSSSTDKKIYQKRYKKFFINYLEELFKTTMPNDKTLSTNDVFEIGQDFFRLMEESKEKNLKENKEYYTKLTREESIEKYEFNWTEYSKELGYKEEDIPKSFYVVNPSYFESCTKILLNEWNSEKWRSYWVWLVARYVIRYTDKWEQIFFRFNATMQGLFSSFRDSKNASTAALCIFGFGSLLNNEYIDYAYNENNIVYATNMANNLKQILINKIRRNSWLDKKTKEYAEFKVEKISINIGSKKINEDFNKILPLLNYNPDELLENLDKILDWRHKLYINNRLDIIDTLAVLDFRKYPAKIVSNSSFLVNAMYIPSNNSINVTTSYLQKPFINLDEEGTEYNLGYIGWTIAHELTHSLDNIGRLYDHNGDLNEWWSKKDIKRYKKIQQEIIKNYELFAKYDKINIDFSSTINEDIADINGLNLCEEYLRDYCLANKWTGVVALYHFKIFYLYFAYHMRQQIEKQSLQYSLFSNPHPLSKYRTNAPLSRSQFFRHVFGIKKGDKMYSDNKTDVF